MRMRWCLAALSLSIHAQLASDIAHRISLTQTSARGWSIVSR